MAKTTEGLPVVTKGTPSKTAIEIRGRSSVVMLAEIEKENPLIADAIRELALRSVPKNRRAVIEKDMATIYQLLKIQGRLDQA